MTGKNMALGLALALAVTAALASPAAAQFESESSPTTLTVSSSSEHKFEIKPGGTTIECATILFDDSTETGTQLTTVSIEPTYSSCTDLFGQDVTVDTNGCDYIAHLADNQTSGTVDVECPSAAMKITVGNLCGYSVDDQTSLSSLSYSNIGSGTTREVQISASVTSITSVRVTNNFPFLCPAGSNQGVYTGTTIVTGENGSGSHVGIFVD